MKDEIKEVAPSPDSYEKKPSFNKPKGNQGRVAFIVNGKVFIEYGKGLGTFIPFIAKEHANLKEGDQIYF